MDNLGDPYLCDFEATDSRIPYSCRRQSSDDERGAARRNETGQCCYRRQNQRDSGDSCDVVGRKAVEHRGQQPRRDRGQPRPMATPQSVNPKPVYQTKAAFTATCARPILPELPATRHLPGEQEGNRAQRGVFPSRETTRADLIRANRPSTLRPAAASR